MLLHKYIISDMYYNNIASTVDDTVREIAHFRSMAKYYIIVTAITEYGRTDGFLRCTLGRGFGECK